eukprot:CAMPEP_0175953898 /NCGR_PEP_ID=MMETSP0108-20121206/31613_1 /TAXON_ID=195067 ORGANISM="Goniomonas pacifica, Strain CCMP1869" /NCGR_SAMPLE_ID=MMETSP0108 /ASSEMBLY_ACC=CAM_ASM_000204 /LENGTH=78 /DNA_ID=CAMNT_0017280523 /DNA_START=25 /DNA_END=257 /DNA_ORIENTATION=+
MDGPSVPTPPPYDARESITGRGTRVELGPGSTAPRVDWGVGRSAEDRPLLWLSSAADVEEVGRGSSTLAQGVGLKAVG